MKTVKITGTLREGKGKADAKVIRNQGRVPCVLYGGKEQVLFTTPSISFKDIVYSPEICQIELEINGTKHMCILQDIQYHPVTDSIIHVDFLAISNDKPIIMAVPVKTEGTSTGVLKGGKLVKKLKKLRIKSLPQHMPDYIMLNISELDINQSIKVADVKRDNVTFLDIPNAVVVAVQTSRTVVEETPAEQKTAAAPVAEQKTEQKTEKKAEQKK